MLDWKTAKPSDFDFVFHAEEITELATHIQIPVRVEHRETKEMVFTKSVLIRKDFYAELKEQPDHISALNVIVVRRCRDELVQRINKKSMSVDDKITLLNQAPQAIE